MARSLALYNLQWRHSIMWNGGKSDKVQVCHIKSEMQHRHSEPDPRRGRTHHHLTISAALRILRRTARANFSCAVCVCRVYFTEYATRLPETPAAALENNGSSQRSPPYARRPHRSRTEHNRYWYRSLAPRMLY